MTGTSELKSPETGSRWIVYLSVVTPLRSGTKKHNGKPILAGAMACVGSPKMAMQRPQKDPIFGYLSMLESSEHGLFGGYLIVSSLGRPLEFHCTTPVRPSRAQQILYGPTLQPYLLGEQIGGTLLGQAKLEPSVILTDQVDAFCLRSQLNFPIVLLASTGRATVDSVSADPLAGHMPAAALPTNERLAAAGQFSFGGCQWEIPSGFEADQPMVVELLQLLGRNVELPEPFDRIHEAIREAQRIGGRTQDTHGQAA